MRKPWHIKGGGDASTFQMKAPQFTVPPWHGQWGKYFAAKDRDEYIVQTCENLRQQAEIPRSHIARMEAILTPLTDCRVFVYGFEPGSFEDELACRAYQILKRLPSTPLELLGLPADLDELYFRHNKVTERSTLAGYRNCYTWDLLRVASLMSVNTVQMALVFVVAGRDIFGQSIEDYPNILAELLEASSTLADRSTSNREARQWYIVRATLWCEWQRSFMLYQFALLRNAIDEGRVSDIRLRASLRSTSPAPGSSIHEFSTRRAPRGKSNAMCSWAFELLRTEPVCLSSDFRTFHDRYAWIWKDAPARCQKDSPLPCAGTNPNECWRFKGMVIEDQSAHDYRCTGDCPKLQWGESSYRSVEGAVAVSVTSYALDSSENRLHYCKATERTMAISHVWSHGQGGRPHVGVNLCLHRRYVDVAKLKGCDSYWWDSACIPEDHSLRFEAIQHINGIFSRSKIILVCDKDLMGIDISESTMRIKESILATILVCDWNLRAWTFLESLKGRHNLHLLCRHNATASFLEIVRDVANHGSIDLAILSFGVPHMFPDVRGLDSWTREQVGQVLSYRPASRSGDDTVIWSILVTGRALGSPKDLWRDKHHSNSEYVHTGFLMSSAPRLSTKGLSWAPSTPYFKPLPQNESRGMSSFRAFVSNETWPGIITARGLQASWHVYEFDTTNLAQPSHQDGPPLGSQADILRQICSLYLQHSSWGALLQPMSNVSTFEQDRDTTTKYNGLIRGTLLAVLGCNGPVRPSEKPPEQRGWTWKGTYEWSEHVPRPIFKAEHEFLIE